MRLRAAFSCPFSVSKSAANGRMWLVGFHMAMERLAKAVLK